MEDSLGWGLVVSTFLASTAWIYQKAWDRAEARRARYEAILGDLSAFTSAGVGADGIERVLAEHRKLWLTGPQPVMQAFTAFLEGVEGRISLTDEERVARMRALVLAMRKDSTIWSVLTLGFKSKPLTNKDLRLTSAARPGPAVSLPPDPHVRPSV